MQALIDPEGVSKPFLKDFWDIHEISSYTGIGLGTLYDIVKNPDFPGPIANTYRLRLWPIEPVRDFFLNRSKSRNSSFASQIHSYKPAQIRTKGKIHG